MDGQGPVAHATPVVVIESGIDFRKVHRLGIDEFRTADGASGTDPRAREQQKGQRSRFSPIVVLEIHECRVHHIAAVIIVFETADREIRNSPLREAAACWSALPASLPSEQLSECACSCLNECAPLWLKAPWFAFRAPIRWAFTSTISLSRKANDCRNFFYTRFQTSSPLSFWWSLRPVR